MIYYSWCILILPGTMYADEVHGNRHARVDKYSCKLPDIS